MAEDQDKNKKDLSKIIDDILDEVFKDWELEVDKDEEDDSKNS